MIFPKIKAHIAPHPDECVFEIGGEPINNIKSIKFEGSSIDFSSVTIEMSAQDIEFEGEIPVYVVFGGKKYYLINAPESHKDREPAVRQMAISRNRSGL